MKRIFQTISIAAASMLLFACEESGVETQQESVIKLSETEFVAGPDGKSWDVTVESSENWRISGKPVEWMSFSATDGKNGDKLTIKVDPNEIGAQLDASFKIFAGSAVAEIKVSSAPDFFMNMESEKAMLVGSNGGTLIVKFDSNVLLSDLQFSLECTNDGADYIHYDVLKDAFGTKQLLLKVDPSASYLDRSSTVTIKDAFTAKEMQVEITQQRIFAFESTMENDFLEVRNLNANDVEFTVQTNISDYSNIETSEWITFVEARQGEMTPEGLYNVTYKLHLEESLGTRAATVAFYEGETVMYRFTMRQQNPNPTYASIPDNAFKDILVFNEWIYSEPNQDGNYELLAKGLEADTFEYYKMYWDNEIKTLEGLQNFPNLEVFKIGSFRMTDLSLPACPKLKEIGIYDMRYLKSINCEGSSVEKIYLIDPSRASFDYTETFTFIGNSVKTIQWDAKTYYERLNTLDVTGCPKLESLSAMREDYGYTSLKKILVTAGQKAAYDAGTLEIKIPAGVTVEVKQ